MVRNMALLLSITALSGVLINPVMATPANNNTVQTQNQSAYMQLLEAFKANPIDGDKVKNLTIAALNENISTASDIFQNAPANARGFVSAAVKQVADNLKSTNPAAYAQLQQAILSASPEFQLAYLEQNGDDEATASIRSRLQNLVNKLKSNNGNGGGAASPN